MPTATELRAELDTHDAEMRQTIRRMLQLRDAYQQALIQEAVAAGQLWPLASPVECVLRGSHGAQRGCGEVVGYVVDLASGRVVSVQVRLKPLERLILAPLEDVTPLAACAGAP